MRSFLFRVLFLEWRRDGQTRTKRTTVLGEGGEAAAVSLHSAAAPNIVPSEGAYTGNGGEWELLPFSFFSVPPHMLSSVRTPKLLLLLFVGSSHLSA